MLAGDMAARGRRDDVLRFRLRHLLPFVPTWRGSAASRLTELEEELARISPDRWQLPTYASVRQRLDDAWAVLAGQQLEQLDADHRAAAVANYRIDRSSSVWMSVHRADEQLILIADDAWVQARTDRIQARLTVEPLDSEGSGSSRYQAFLADLLQRRLEPNRVVFDDAARTRLAFILRQLNRRSEVAEAKLRSFRNVLIGLQLALLLMIVGIAIAAIAEPRLWSLCGPAPEGGALVCPDGTKSPGPLDVSLVELMGGLGGLLSAIFFIAGLDNFPNPHGIQLVQGLLKVPAGAALALVVTLLVQRGTLEVVAPQPGTRALPLAVLLGFAQQIVTTALDRRARGLLGETEAAVGVSGAYQPAAGDASALPVSR